MSVISLSHLKEVTDFGQKVPKGQEGIPFLSPGII